MLKAHSSEAQKQIVLLKNERVKLRLLPGDELIFRLKGSKTIIRSYLNNISDTALVAHTSIIPYHTIDRIYFKQSNFMNVIGGLCVTAGVGLFAIDFLNTTAVQDRDYDWESGVVTTSAVLVGVGTPLLLAKKNSQRIRGKNKLLPIDKRSVFYRESISNTSFD
jgi:hypothetical protein